jgi:hypothetical protein
VLDFVKAHEGLDNLKLVLSVVLLSPLVGFMAATQVKPTGSFLADGIICTLAPWAFWVAVFKAVAEVRVRRFGPNTAPSLGALDLFAVVASTLVGPWLAYTFIGRAVASKDEVDIILACAGVFACIWPVYAVARSVTKP